MLNRPETIARYMNQTIVCAGCGQRHTRRDPCPQDLVRAIEARSRSDPDTTPIDYGKGVGDRLADGVLIRSLGDVPGDATLDDVGFIFDHPGA